MGLIIIKYFKYYYKSQIAYFNSFLGFLDEKHNDILKKNFIFKYFYTSFHSKKAIRILVIFNLVSFIYSVIVYNVDPRVKANGFCGTRYYI